MIITKNNKCTQILPQRWKIPGSLVEGRVLSQAATHDRFASELVRVGKHASTTRVGFLEQFVSFLMDPQPNVNLDQFSRAGQIKKFAYLEWLSCPI
jgi:hypothetical protein